MVSGTIRKLQLVELGILKKFITICEENQLCYYLCGGTLLGAIRHKGFIPWDDDIDVAMPREDYDRFYKIYKDKYHETDDKFFIDIADSYSVPYILITNKSIQISFNVAVSAAYKYAWMDVFPIDGFPKNKLLGNIHIRNFLIRKILYIFSNFDDLPDQKHKWSFHKRMIAKIINKLKIHKLFNGKQKYFNFANKILLKYSMYKTDKCCLFWGAYKYKDIFPTGWFGEGVPVKFEDITANAPCNYDSYLRQLYGDYMVLPPEDKRHGHNIEIITQEETK
jgi:lipopolysaccharide cholinephosphotransferase